MELYTNFILNFHDSALLKTGVFIIFVLMWVCIFKYKSSRKKNLFTNQHVVITGGSSGIGKSFARLMASEGANVTILARDPTKLENTKDEVSKLCTSPLQQIITISVDVSKDADGVERAIADAEERSGPVFMLVNCAGAAMCSRIEDTSIDDFKYMVDLNFFGTVYCTKAVICGMKKRRNGYIVIVSSQAGMVGVFGYCAYSGSKFALRGFAEALDREVRAFGVQVTLCFPPDTDTPCFKKENESKPIETQLITGNPSGPVSPDCVAKQLFKDIIDGKFFSSVGFEGFLVKNGCAGAAPVTTAFEVIFQVCFMGVIRIIALCYNWSFHRIVRKCKKEKERANPSG